MMMTTTTTKAVASPPAPMLLLTYLYCVHTVPESELINRFPGIQRHPGAFHLDTDYVSTSMKNKKKEEAEIQ